MILIWTGRGFLVPLFTVGVTGLLGAVTTFVFGRDVVDRHEWLYAVAFVISTVVNWYFGRRIQRRNLFTFSPGPRFRRASRAKNSFCFVDMEYWSLAMLLAAAVVAVRSLT